MAICGISGGTRRRLILTPQPRLAPGGLVWVVSDERVDGGESGAAFRQALGFMALGLMLH